MIPGTFVLTRSDPTERKTKPHSRFDVEPPKVDLDRCFKIAMASHPIAMASHPIAMASNLIAMATNLIAMASN